MQAIEKKPKRAGLASDALQSRPKKYPIEKEKMLEKILYFMVTVLVLAGKKKLLDSTTIEHGNIGRWTFNFKAV